MADVVPAAVRSRMMAGIRASNTQPELLLRKGLHARGFRFRLHDKRLPGKPDIVLPRYRAAIFAHGCFWHGHDCHLFKWPATRTDFWKNKIERNRFVDERTTMALRAAGWRQAIVWECALKGRSRLSLEQIVSECEGWLKSDRVEIEVKGK